jgi:hypothetical protein
MRSVDVPPSMAGSNAIERQAAKLTSENRIGDPVTDSGDCRRIFGRNGVLSDFSNERELEMAGPGRVTFLVEMI